MIRDSKELIREILSIDLYKAVEANPRRPFDNQLTMKLLLDEVIRIISRFDETN
jgi:hypothetical protein